MKLVKIAYCGKGDVLSTGAVPWSMTCHSGTD